MIIVSISQHISTNLKHINKHSVFLTKHLHILMIFELIRKYHVIMFNWYKLELVFINGNRLPCVNVSLKSLVLTVSS